MGYVIHLPCEGDVGWRSVLAVITGQLFPGKRAYRSAHTPLEVGKMSEEKENEPLKCRTTVQRSTASYFRNFETNGEVSPRRRK